jgi:hypothetical protein
LDVQPVGAGHDYFPQDLMSRYFGDYARSLGLSMDQFMALGRRNPRGTGRAADRQHTSRRTRARRRPRPAGR